MTNKIDTVLKAITDQIAGALPSDAVKNQKLIVDGEGSDGGVCVEAFAIEVGDGGLAIFGEYGGEMLGERGGEGGRRVLCLQVFIIDIRCRLE
ncbi:hypothetical protein Tco_0543572 [Tanacetum coccineum]